MLKLRGQGDDEMSERRKALEKKLASIGDGKSAKSRTAVAPKYRDKEGNSWSGRGLMAGWLKKAIKGGAKLESFLVK